VVVGGATLTEWQPAGFHSGYGKGHHCAQPRSGRGARKKLHKFCTSASDHKKDSQDDALSLRSKIMACGRWPAIFNAYRRICSDSSGSRF